MHALPPPHLPIRIIFHRSHLKHFPRHLHEPHVRPPPLLEAEITYRIRTYQFPHRLQQQRERGFEVHTVGCEEYVRGRRYRVRDGSAPVEDVGCGGGGRGVEGDIEGEERNDSREVGEVDLGRAKRMEGEC